MCRFISLFLFISAIFPDTPLRAASSCDFLPGPGTAWELSAQTALADIYQPAGEADSPPAVLVRIQWDSDPDLLYRIIWDYEHFADFIPNVTSSRILAKQAGHAWVYQQLNLPGPASDRHYIIVSTDVDSKPAQHHYRVEWTLSEQYPLPDAGRRLSPEHFRGCWRIDAATTRGLTASYWIELDPGGLLPHWMTQAALRHYVSDLMNALHRRMQSNPFSQH